MAMSVTVASPMRALLRKNHITAREVAHRMGMSESGLSRLLNGSRPWRLRHLRAMSLVTGIPMATLRTAVDL